MKKLWHRFKQNVSQKFGWSDQTKDEEYDAVFGRYSEVATLVAQCMSSVNSLQTAYTTSMLQYQQLGDSLKSIYEHGDRYERSAERLKQNIAHMERDLQKTLYDELPNKCIGKLTEYQSMTSEIKDLIKQRRKVVLEFDFRRNKFIKTKDTKAEDKARRKVKMESARRVYDQINQTCVSKMYEFIERRSEFLDPFLEGLVAVARDYSYHMNKEFEDVAAAMQNAECTRSGPTSYKPLSKAEKDEGSASGSSSAPVETTATGRALGSAGPAPPPRRNPPPAVPAPASANSLARAIEQLGDEFYYLDSSNEKVGPMSLEALKRTFKAGTITESTMVFGHGMKNWEEIKDYSALSTFLKA